jgi:hypothetical protein
MAIFTENCSCVFSISAIHGGCRTPRDYSYLPVYKTGTLTARMQILQEQKSANRSVTPPISS